MRTLRTTGSLILLITGMAMLPDQSWAATIYVNGSLGSGTGLGTSWANAYRGSTALSDAINVSLNGDQIWVAQGTYIPTRDRFGIATGGNEATFILRGGGFRLLGGFAGTETDANQQDPEANPTILSGNDQKYHVVTAHFDNAVTTATLLDGFTITGGDADGDSAFEEDRGAGLKTSSADLTVANCIFVDNRSISDGAGAWAGPSRFVNCKFLGNFIDGSAAGGAGLFNTGSATLLNCVFSGNTIREDGLGAGLYGTNSQVYNCTFVSNHASVTNAALGNGGAIFLSGGFSAPIYNSILWNNSAAVGSQIGGSIGTVSSFANLIQGGFSGFNILTVDPMFVDADGPDDVIGTLDDNVRLSPGSPAVESGLISLMPLDPADLDRDGNFGEQPPIDLDGNERVQFPGCGQVDLGPYEFERIVTGPILYVDVNSSGADNGSSWTDAFRSLRTALCAASTAGGAVTEVWVANGTYRTDPQAVNPSFSFQLVDGVAIYGGFAGGETQREDRNPVANVCILSGDMLGNDLGGPTYFPFDASYNENAYHVVQGDGVGPTAVLDGFTIEGGKASLSPPGADEGRGGGIYLNNSSPTLSNLIIQRNLSLVFGGGLFCSAGDPAITSCQFIENYSDDALGGGSGGGAYMFGSLAVFDDCEFSKNDAPSAGGAMLTESSNLRILNSTFMENRSDTNFGGGAINIKGGTARIEQSHFESNFANFGGAIAGFSSLPRLIGCTFRNNEGFLTGGAIYHVGSFSGVVAINSTFEGNKSEDGGAIALGDCSANTINCVFAGNQATTLGGAVYLNDSAISLNQATLAYNDADNSGGGVYQIGGVSSVQVVNSIIWGNTHGAGVNDFSSQFFDSGIGTNVISIVRSNIQHLTPLINSNISEDPLFIRAADDGGNGFGDGNDDYGNLRMAPTSPSIDVLNASTAPADVFDIDGDTDSTETIPFEADGFARVKDLPFFDNGGTLDMGAYELPSANIRFWGEELEPPAIADDPTQNPPVVDNLSAAFIHPFDNRVFGYDFGLVNIQWTAGGVPAATTVQYVVLEATPTVCMYRTDLPNNGPVVDMSPIIDGNPIGSVVIHYNNQIDPDPAPADPLINADVFVDPTKRMNAQKAGSVLIEYRNEQTGELLAFETLRVRNRIPTIVPDVDVGDQVFPTDLANYDPACTPVVTQGLNMTAFQQADDGPTKGQVYAIRPNTNPSAFEVYWLKGGFGGVCWPCELNRYTAVWPSDPQINLRSSDPKVDLSAHFLSQILYQFPVSHAMVVNNEYSTSQPGMATVLYSDNVDSGRLVSLEVVKTVESDDAGMGFPIQTTHDIGNRIESASHDLDCYSSSFIREGTNYDPTIYEFKAEASHIIAVNTGQLEIWHYQKSQEVCWPYLPFVYNCLWPEVPDFCLTISNQKGMGPFGDAKYLNTSIYSIGTEDSDPTVIGYNPNEEHAEWETIPGGKLYAARDDLNGVFGRSQPYVLLKYQDDLLPGDPWEMDVIQVQRSEGSSPSGCVCTQEPCDFVYGVTAGVILQPLIPLSLPVHVPLCPENTIIDPDYTWFDDRGGYWYRRGDVSTIARYYERWEGTCTPWLDDGTGIPLDVTWNVGWPKVPQSSLPPGGGGVPIKDVFIDIGFGETRIRDLSNGVRQAEILYNESDAVLIRPWKPAFVSLPSSNFPNDWLVFRRMLPPHIQSRLSYEDVNQLLVWGAVPDQKLLGIMSVQERDKIKAVFNLSHHASFRNAVDALYAASQQPGSSAVGTIVGPDNPAWGIALSAGNATEQGWVVLGYNGDQLIVEPADVEVFNVGCPPKPGEVIAIYPDCVFDEQLTMHWSGDCGGDCMDFEFFWEFAVGDNPGDYDEIDPNANPDDPPAFNPWNLWVHDDGSSGWVKGKNEVVISGQSANPIFVLTDNWFRVKVRIPPDADPDDYACPPGTESEFTDHQLAEGWIKRVKRQLNPFDQRVKQFTEARIATYVSMIEQLGTPYTDRVGLTCDAETLNSLGLIELYQGVLFRGRSFTIDLGIDYGPANQALLLMAGAIADFYMLLGNEAYGDSLDSTLIITDEIRDQATSLFSFQDQLPSNEDSLLYEELALLRGMDGRSGTEIDRFPVYNRLYWNFTSGDGQVAYRNNYNIQDRAPLNMDGSRGDGFFNEEDAEVMFPQGHGDAWGHYLTAIKYYYELLRNPSFTWEVRTEAVLVNQVPIQVGYTHERKMARAAAARAKAGASVMDLTYRERYTEEPSQQTQGYPDQVEDRNWGLQDWGHRSFLGAYYDWATTNANLPAVDDDPDHVGTVKQIDRTTVYDLKEITAQADVIQGYMDQADAGLNPLGLPKNVVPFDLQPFDEAGRTHFEQVFDRALPAVVNAVQVFRFASQIGQSLRQNQDESQEFEDNTEDAEFDFEGRLIELFGYPYPQDKNPSTGNTYGPTFNGPDLYHWMYVDVGDLVGLSLPAGQTITVPYFNQTVNDQGVLVTPQNQSATVNVTFNVVPGFGFVKPVEFTLERKAPGEIQLARSDLIQAHWAFKQATQEYGDQIKNIEAFVQLITDISGIRSDQINLLYANIGATTVMNTLIIASRITQSVFTAASKSASELSDSVAASMPTVVGLANDITAPLRGAVMVTGKSLAAAFETIAEVQETIQLGIEQAKELADKGTEIEIQIKENQVEFKEKLFELRQMVRDLKAKEIEIYGLQEAMRQASGKYLQVVAQGLRLLEERTAFRIRTAAAVSDARYKDMAFRIFRNDALQKYRGQFDLAAKFVYLSAKAYGYETNLLEFSPLSGEELLQRIVRERTIGEFDDTSATAGGLPFRAGSGLSGVMADLDANFRALKGVLGFNNPTISTDKFSLRSEYYRILADATGEDNWRETLELNVIDDLRTQVPEFNQLLSSFDPYRQFDLTNPTTTGEPAIVIEFPTTIQADANVFNRPGSTDGGESFFPSDHFSIKVRGVGVWFSNYAGGTGGLTSTPRCYLIPVGADVTRVPEAQSLGSLRKIREWNVVDQVIPPPSNLGEGLFAPRLNGWLPSDQLPGQLLQPRLRRHASIRAFSDEGEDLSEIDETEFLVTTNLVGRSVWNTRWLLIIPGRFLLQGDPNEGIRRFIEGADGNGGVTDIRLAFETFQYSGSKKDGSAGVKLGGE